VNARPEWNRDTRLAGLQRFAFAITLLNVLGHTVLGFEQSWAQPIVSLAAAYSAELLLEWLDAWSAKRKPRFLGGPRVWVNFLLSAHITGLACAMLLYANDRLWPVAFASTAAIASKAIFRIRVGGRERHFLNPSNLGISSTLLLFHWVGIAPPYMFTENLTGAGDWILPGIIVLSGSFLNAKFTGRVPLILAWLGTFVLQALVRSAVFGMPPVAALLPMTGLAFLLFSFYMVTDPATTPDRPRAQIAFGAAVALTYGVLVSVHVVYGLFFALTAVCAARGIALAMRSGATAPVAAPLPSPVPEVSRMPGVPSTATVSSATASGGAGECA
jgi:hypothetical protein